MFRNRLTLVASLLFVSFGLQPAVGQVDETPANPTQTERAQETGELIWSGARLEDWEISDFGTQREIKPIEGGFELTAGYPLTGVFSKAIEWPTSDYELTWEFQRLEGRDFPCCTTFPVGNSHCSFVIGGWGGTLCGLSCLDGKDAAHNQTAKHVEIENGKWHRARVLVSKTQIRCWLNDEIVVDQPIEGLQVSVRNEVRLSRPFGICSYETTAQIRNIKVLKAISGAEH